MSRTLAITISSGPPGKRPSVLYLVITDGLMPVRRASSAGLVFFILI